MKSEYIHERELILTSDPRPHQVLSSLINCQHGFIDNRHKSLLVIKIDYYE